MGATNNNTALNNYPSSKLLTSFLIKRNKDNLSGPNKMRLAIYLAPLILLAFEHVKPANAILNCFTPNMFKMNKGYPASAGAERANWYPLQYSAGGGLPPTSGSGSTGFSSGGGGYAAQLGGYSGQNPMKYLFQPKWKTGGGLFGGKSWANWKMGMNSNFYRPNAAGYGGTMPGYGINPAAPPIQGYFSEQLTMSPYALHNPINSYSNPVVTNPNDGWTSPVSLAHQQPAIQQSLISTYDSYTQSPIKPSQLVVDPYATKGASAKYTGTGTVTSTTKNALSASTNAFGYNDGLTLAKPSYGYSYPEWYSGVIDSPAKVAQQLYKYGLRKQHPQHHKNRSAPLISPSSGSFTILDEPRFVGFGSIDLLTNKEARLGCSFNEAIDLTNRPLWIKFTGPYNSSQVINGKNIPPFNCANSQCRTQEIESTKDYRYKFDNGPATSTLIISEPRLSDYGIYRCSALTKGINNNPLETIYQIVYLGGLE